MDDVKNPKDVRAFWERKANSVESPHSPLGRHGFSTVVRHGEDPAGEAKRRTNEELNEVLKQRRHSSASPEPHVITYRKPVTRSTNRDSTRSADGRSHRDSWKKTAVAAAAAVAERTTYTNTRSISPQPFYIHNDSTKAKMAERTSIFKRASSTKPHPLKPTNSSKYKSLPPPPPSSKRRPFSTSAIEGSIAVASSQSTDSRHQSLQPIYQDDIDGPCNEQHLMERDSVPDNVKLFRTLLDGITKERRSCYLKSPVISQHLTATSRGRMDSILCKEDYLVTMVTVVVEISEHKEPITLSMRVGVTVSHVIEAILDVLPKLHPLRSHDLLLKVCGRDEYLDNDMLLSDYEYTHQCLKFGLDVHIAMVTLASANQTFSSRPSSPKQEDYFLCFNNSAIPFSREPLNRLLCLFFNKVEQYRSTIQSSCSKMLISMAEGLIHSTQLICQLLSTIEPLTVCEAIHYIKQTTMLLLNVLRDDKQQDVVSPFTPSDSEPYTTFEGWNLIELPNSPVGSLEALQQKALSTTDTLKDAVMEFVADYCTSFNMPFMPVWTGSRDIAQDHISTVNISSLNEPIRIKVCCLHRVGTLSYHMYQVEACLYYGGCQIGKTRFSHRSRVKKSFFNSITWDEWFNFSLISELPLETRICFTIYGCESLQRKPIGWVAMPLFNINKHLQTGEHYLCVWPTTEGANPIGTCDGNHSDDDSMILQVAFDRRSNAVVYDDVVNTKSVSHGYPSLPTEHALRAAAQKDHFNTLTEEEQQLLWNNRKALPRVLHSCPRGLPLLLLSVPKHDHTHLKEVHAIVDQWKLPHPIDSLELLNVQFADVYVRAKALSWLQELSSDDLFDLLPQLVQVIKYDWYGFLGTTKFLLQQAVKSPRIAHMLFWLTHPLLNDPSFGLQYMMLWVGLKIVCNGPIGEALDQQLTMVQSLNDIATAVKTAKDSSRLATLLQHLKRHSTQLSCTQHRLPLSLSMLVSGMDIDNCSFFNSNTVPLKLTFVNQNPRGDKIPIIFKVGDDLRQDMLTLQLIKLMEKLWLRAGLDLKLITYLCLSTGPNQGMLEMVTEAETLRSIQTSHGLTGAFNDKRLSQWLMKHNTTDVSYKKATECFIRSCAGYCVATYVLGICDRHNDNIMVKESGHMFHIDFGRIFGNAQMFGNIKRDRAPFVLTPDMAYVINGGDTPTTSFQKFTDLCCTAYNELRRNCNLFINLLELMLTSGMPELSSSEDVQYVRDALLPGVTDTEATIAFTRCIEASLGSKATQINFFIHNLAQMKFGSVANLTDGVLSFCPTSYSSSKEERILSAQVTKCLKRYYPQRYYVYLIEVTRPHNKELVFRRYSEFHEMHTKMVANFPDHTFPALPGKIYVGRSQVRHVSEKRRIQLNEYLQSLFKMDSIVAESDILCTFLHRMIRDEVDSSKMDEDMSDSSYSGSVSLSAVNYPKVKLCISYDSSDQELVVMVRHARNLVPVHGTNTANPYVKVYLLPDPYKTTKKKTKVAKKTLHPTYNETLKYYIPQAELLSRTLYLCVWDQAVLPKQCLGAITIDVASLTDLTSGIEDWYNLEKPHNSSLSYAPL